MTRNSHIVISGGIAASCVALCTKESVLFPPIFSALLAGVLSAFGGIVPDLDAAFKGKYVAKDYLRSILLYPFGGILVLLGVVIYHKGRMIHRGFSHSLLGVLLFTVGNMLSYFIVVVLPSVLHGSWLVWGWKMYVLMGTVGYLLHLVADACTVYGVPLWFPFSEKRYRLLPHKYALKTGSMAEVTITLIIAIFTGLVLFKVR